MLRDDSLHIIPEPGSIWMKKRMADNVTPLHGTASHSKKITPGLSQVGISSAASVISSKERRAGIQLRPRRPAWLMAAPSGTSGQEA